MKKEKEYENEKMESYDASIFLDAERKKVRRTNWLPAVWMIAGVLMMAYGIIRGEMAVVFSKAIQICLECIGIG